MKNLKPFQILIAGSLILFLTSLVSLLFLNKIVDFDPIWLFILPAISGTVSYVVFYFFIKRFITEKLKILYRSIRKGKINNDTDQSFSILDDVIERAEVDTEEWTDEKNSEILRLKEQEEFRREFIGNIAHELKTPVFSIQGYILTLLDGGLEDENVNRAFLERASKATDRMTNILNDLDHLAKLEVSDLLIEMTRFDIKELVKDVFEELENKAKEKNIILGFAKGFDPVFVSADKVKIGQVLMNLINNSIHYGNDGGETQVRFYLMDNIVTVEVSDDGPGIGDEDLPRLFERFYRVEKSRARNQGGSGIGLAIAKHFIEAHNQTISVRSTLGVGSTFTFSLDIGKKNE
ncbi:ATP-binding protein [Crocinitomicaceae bacterium]|nr:ATP-binding protein [Crocinitomicaceae bacterium]MDC1385677.1 ATP-binding protein [Crocinitomicaceae bacterium]